MPDISGIIIREPDGSVKRSYSPVMMCRLEI
jgi:hypothetical protein